MASRAQTGGLAAAGRRELTAVLAQGRTTTIWSAAAALGVSNDEAAKRLAAWTSRGWLRRVRRGLYLGVPVDAPDPFTWSEDAWYLADLVWHPCYITGWSAANHWSLTDQVFRSTVLATVQRVRRVEQDLAGNNYLVHHVAQDAMGWGMCTEWRHDRRILIADPTRTVAEMLGTPALGGGIRHVIEILGEYLIENSAESLIEPLEKLSNGAAFKRLGFLLEHLGNDDTRAIDRAVKNLTTGIASLDPLLPPNGARSSRWGLIVNADIAS